MSIPKKTIALAILALVILFIGYNAIFTWPPEAQAKAKQEKLIAAIEAKKWGRVHRLTSPTYQGSLGLDRDNLLLAFKDAGSQFWTKFELNWEMTNLERDGDIIVITGNLRLNGEGGPGAPLIVNHARPYAKQPFTFRWRKTGIAPWKWQLESLAHPSARLPDDYTPGDVRNYMRGGQF